ncbi:MAG: phosphohydrolase [Minisyncoccia bacterium]
MITLKEVNNNKHILEFIRKSEETLKRMGYTEHGLKHVTLVSDRARNIAKEIGLTKEEQEMCAISGFCHDMGNFLSRSHHHYLGSILFYEVFKDKYLIEELIPIMQAIAVHDKDELEFSSSIPAVLVIADKSDVRRSRVYAKSLEEIKGDIHHRVNFATKNSKVKVFKNKKIISLTLEIDSSITPIMEYFEIFTQRMVYCRKAADYLGYKFGLKINNFKLL